jgi:predicted amidohydrolase YtcJ
MSRKIFFNAKVLTQDKLMPEAEAFIVQEDKFIAVGNTSTIFAQQSADDILIDLEGNYVIPGFNDAHIHIWKVGNLMTHMLDLRDVKSITAMQQKIKAYAIQNPHLSWIQARGFNEANFIEQRFPTKHDLDSIQIDKPICVTRTCAHQIIVNSKALEIAEIDLDTAVPAGGEMKLLTDGTVSGHFTETAIGLILSKIPRYTKAELRHMVLAAQEHLLQLGITSATDPAVDRDLLSVYKEMDVNGELKLRINAIPIRVPDGANKVYPNPEHYHSAHLVVNTVKFFADGGLSGKTAAMLRPYKNDNTHGVLRLDTNTFHELAASSQAAGFKIATHAIGDAAIKMVLDVYTSIAPENKQNLCHRIEHLGFPDSHDLQTMCKLGIIAVMQPMFIEELGNNIMQNIDDQYLTYVYPVRNIINAGVTVAFSTDAPVVKQINPIKNIQAAITRKTNNGIHIAAEQAISLEEAIYAYTMGSAIAGSQEAQLGSIEKGKFADFIILSDIQPEATQILQTYIAGKRI